MCNNIFKIVILCSMIPLLVFIVGCDRVIGERPIHKAANKGDFKKVKR